MSNLRNRILAVQQSEDVRDGLLLLLRLLLAWIFIYHGAGKLFNYKGLGGIHGTSHYFASIGIHPSTVFAYASGITEFVGGLLALIGLGTPVVGLALLVDMIVAIASTNLSNGLIAEKAAGGFEINLALGAMAVTIALLGAGRVSLDRLIGIASRGPRSTHPQASMRL